MRFFVAVLLGQAVVRAGLFDGFKKMFGGSGTGTEGSELTGETATGYTGDGYSNTRMEGETSSSLTELPTHRDPDGTYRDSEGTYGNPEDTYGEGYDGQDTRGSEGFDHHGRAPRPSQPFANLLKKNEAKNTDNDDKGWLSGMFGRRPSRESPRKSHGTTESAFGSEAEDFGHHRAPQATLPRTPSRPRSPFTLGGRTSQSGEEGEETWGVDPRESSGFDPNDLIRQSSSRHTPLYNRRVSAKDGGRRSPLGRISTSEASESGSPLGPSPRNPLGGRRTSDKLNLGGRRRFKHSETESQSPLGYTSETSSTRKGVGRRAHRSETESQSPFGAGFRHSRGYAPTVSPLPRKTHGHRRRHSTESSSGSSTEGSSTLTEGSSASSSSTLTLPGHHRHDDTSALPALLPYGHHHHRHRHGSDRARHEVEKARAKADHYKRARERERARRSRDAKEYKRKLAKVKEEVYREYERYWRGLSRKGQQGWWDGLRSQSRKGDRVEIYPGISCPNNRALIESWYVTWQTDAAWIWEPKLVYKCA